MIPDIDPKVDYAFKHLLGKKSTRAILADVIDSVLDSPPGRRIREIELLNPFNEKETDDDKLSVLDIKARDESGRQFNVEMQMLVNLAYPKRIFYYASKLHQQQLREGQDYPDLMPTISISFLNQVLYPQISSHHLHFRLLEETHHFSLTSDIEFHILELPKFTKSADQLTSSLDIWLYFLRNATKMDTDALPAPLQTPLVLRALEELTMLSQSDIEREHYEARRKFQMDYSSGLKVVRMEEKISTINFCEKLLDRPETPKERLQSMSLEQLIAIAQELQDKLIKAK